MRVLQGLADQIVGPNSSVERLAHSLPAQKIFPDPTAPLTDDLLEAMDDLCRHEAVAPPRVYSLRGKLHPALLIHWRAQVHLLRKLSMADRWAYRRLWEGARIMGRPLPSFGSSSRPGARERRQRSPSMPRPSPEQETGGREESWGPSPEASPGGCSQRSPSLTRPMSWSPSPNASPRRYSQRSPPRSRPASWRPSPEAGSRRYSQRSPPRSRPASWSPLPEPVPELSHRGPRQTTPSPDDTLPRNFPQAIGDVDIRTPGSEERRHVEEWLGMVEFDPEPVSLRRLYVHVVAEY